MHSHHSSGSSSGLSSVSSYAGSEGTDASSVQSLFCSDLNRSEERAVVAPITSSAPGNRGRKVLNCDNCRKRKSRCDRTYPVCSECAGRKDSICTWQTANGGTGTTSGARSKTVITSATKSARIAPAVKLVDSSLATGSRPSQLNFSPSLPPTFTARPPITPSQGQTQHFTTPSGAKLSAISTPTTPPQRLPVPRASFSHLAGSIDHLIDPELVPIAFNSFPLSKLSEGSMLPPVRPRSYSNAQLSPPPIQVPGRLKRKGEEDFSNETKIQKVGTGIQKIGAALVRQVPMVNLLTHTLPHSSSHQSLFEPQKLYPQEFNYPPGSPIYHSQRPVTKIPSISDRVNNLEPSPKILQSPQFSYSSPPPSPHSYHEILKVNSAPVKLAVRPPLGKRSSSNPSELTKKNLNSPLMTMERRSSISNTEIKAWTASVAKMEKEKVEQLRIIENRTVHVQTHFPSVLSTPTLISPVRSLFPTSYSYSSPYPSPTHSIYQDSYRSTYHSPPITDTPIFPSKEPGCYHTYIAPRPCRIISYSQSSSLVPTIQPKLFFQLDGRAVGLPTGGLPAIGIWYNSRT